MSSDKLYAVSVRFSFVNKVLSCGKDIPAGSSARWVYLFVTSEV